MVAIWAKKKLLFYGARGIASTCFGQHGDVDGELVIGIICPISLLIPFDLLFPHHNVVAAEMLDDNG